MVTTTTEPVPRPAAADSSEHLAGEVGIPAFLMRDPCHLEVLIPARNEAHRLPHTLARTLDYLEQQPYSSSVVVIDNGSADHTADLAAGARSSRVPVRLIGCARPGKGAAVRRGILTSRARFVGYMDADLATPIETLDIVVPLLGQSSVVVGSRRIGGASMARRQPVHRAVGGMIFRALAQQALRGVADTQCGFKFFMGDLARAAALQLSIDGFAFDVEMLQAVSDMGYAITEVPVVWSDNAGSTFRATRDGMRAATDLYRVSRRRPS